MLIVLCYTDKMDTKMNTKIELAQLRRRVERLERLIADLAPPTAAQVKSAAFEYLLDLYYAQCARGEKPNLRRMSEDADVKYGSLRQYKIRYDVRKKATS